MVERCRAESATDRAHRIGQKNVVTVYKLVSQGTIEEKIIDIQEKKKKLAEQVLEGEGMDSVVFTKRGESWNFSADQKT